MKRVLDEEFTPETQRLFHDAIRDRHTILAPTPLPGEVVNALYQRVRTNRPEYHLTEEEAEGSLAAFLTTCIFGDTPDRLERRKALAVPRVVAEGVFRSVVHPTAELLFRTSAGPCLDERRGWVANDYRIVREKVRHESIVLRVRQIIQC